MDFKVYIERLQELFVIFSNSSVCLFIFIENNVFLKKLSYYIIFPSFWSRLIKRLKNSSVHVCIGHFIVVSWAFCVRLC